MKVFISHSRRDADTAEDLSRFITKHGFETVLPHALVLPGENWAEQYASALRSADALVAIVSKRDTSNWSVAQDIQYAFGEQRFKDRLIAFYEDHPKDIGATELPWAIKKVQHVDAYAKQSRDEAFESVVDILKQIRS